MVRSEGKLEGVVPKLFAHLVVAQTILDMKLEMQKKHPMFSGFFCFFQTLRWCRGGFDSSCTPKSRCVDKGNLIAISQRLVTCCAAN